MSRKHHRHPPVGDPDDIGDPQPARPRRAAAERGARAVAQLAEAERAAEAAERAAARAAERDARQAANMAAEREERRRREMIANDLDEIRRLSASVLQRERERAFFAEATGTIDLVEEEELEEVEAEIALLERNSRLDHSPAVDARVRQLQEQGLTKAQLEALLAALPSASASRSEAQQIEFTSIGNRLHELARAEYHEQECRRLREYWARGAPPELRGGAAPEPGGKDPEE